MWTTFSTDQIDLNFACPEVMAEILNILVGYARAGARFIRLDAIGFLWKKRERPVCIFRKLTRQLN